MNKKTKKEGDVLVDSLLSRINSQQLLKMLLRSLYQEQGLQLPELIHVFQEARQEASIPLSIFSSSLDPAEALYKFLKENESLSFQEIAARLHRGHKSIWATYQRSGKKKKQVFLIQDEKYFLPFSIFTKRKYSLLESVVFYLNSVHRLSNQQIAKLLHRTPNTVAVLMKRARDKHGSADHGTA